MTSPLFARIALVILCPVHSCGEKILKTFANSQRYSQFSLFLQNNSCPWLMYCILVHNLFWNYQMGNIHDSNKMSAVPWTEHCTSNEKWVFYGIIKIKQFRASSGTVPLRTSSVNFHSSVNRFFLQMVENWERILQHFILLLLVVLSIISKRIHIT